MMAGMSNTELLIPASRAKALLLFVGCAAFVAMGYAIVGRNPAIGWLTMVFFGLGLSVSLLMLVSNRVYLKLTPEGIETSSLFSKRLIRWADISGFRMGQIRNARMIEIVYRPRYTEQAALRKVSSAMAGMEGAIANSYTVPLNTLLERLNEWHARYGAAA